MPVYYYDPPDRFVAGSVGQPGDRTFYLQAASSGRVTSVVLEKFQVSLLAERIDELLDELLRRTGGNPAIPAAAPAALRDDAPLDLPLTEEFRVGAIALAWDSDGDRVVIEAQEESEEPVEPLAEDVPPDGPGVLRVRLTPGAARAFAQRALQLVAAGRPPCPLCGCRWTPPGRLPAQNGHRPMPDTPRPPTWIPDGNAALELLERLLEVEGRLVGASNATLYCTIKGGAPRRTACGRRSRRAAAGLPDRTLAGRRSPPTRCRGPRLERGAADRDKRRAIRPGHVPAVDRPGPRGGPVACPAAATTRVARDGGVRRGRQQRRQEDRPLPPVTDGHPTADHGSASPRSTSCAPCLAVARARRCRGTRSRPSAASPTTRSLTGWPTHCPST
jgi:uncharacterized repeat protein (TIGR03847 family)